MEHVLFARWDVRSAVYSGLARHFTLKERCQCIELISFAVVNCCGLDWSHPCEVLACVSRPEWSKPKRRGRSDVVRVQEKLKVRGAPLDYRGRKGLKQRRQKCSFTRWQKIVLAMQSHWLTDVNATEMRNPSRSFGSMDQISSCELFISRITFSAFPFVVCHISRHNHRPCPYLNPAFARPLEFATSTPWSKWWIRIPSTRCQWCMRWWLGISHPKNYRGANKLASSKKSSLWDLCFYFLTC